VHVRAVRARRGGGSPAVCAEVVHAAGDARWARRPPQATAFRGEGDGEGGVEGGWRGRRRRRCRSSRWHQDCRRHSGGDDRHWDAAKRESTRSTPADFAGSQAMVSAAHRIAGSERTGSGGERWRQRKAAAQQIPVLRRSHAESRMGSIQHAVGTRGPGRCRRHGPSFSCLGQNDLPFRTGGINPFRQDRSPFQRKKEGYWTERGPRGRFYPYEPPRGPSLHGLGRGGLKP